MSLDIYLYVKKERKSKIVVNGKKLTYNQVYDALGVEGRPLAFVEKLVFDVNITHNLNSMADAAGVYKAMWRPEEIPVSKASELIGVLSSGLQELSDNPDAYKKLNPSNGWGNYDILVEVVKQYLEACERYPNAEIYVSR